MIMPPFEAAVDLKIPRLQIAQCRSYSWTLGPNVGIFYRHVALGTITTLDSKPEPHRPPVLTASMQGSRDEPGCLDILNVLHFRRLHVEETDIFKTKPRFPCTAGYYYEEYSNTYILYHIKRYYIYIYI